MSDELETSGTESTASTADTATDTGMDIGAAAADIAHDLWGRDNQDAAETTTDDAAADTATDDPAGADKAAAAESTPDTPAVARPIDTPPQSWAKEKHGIWSTMAPEAREYYLQREEQMFKGIQQYKDDAAFGQPLKQVITPFMPMIQARGITPDKAVAALLNAQYRLDQNPLEGIKHLAAAYKIDLSQLAGAATEAAQVDPAVKALQDELNGIKTHLSAAQEAQMAEARTKVAGEVNKFAEDPAHPYFDEVAEDVMIYVKGGADLATAYEKAVWANPVTRAKEIARVQTEQQRVQREKAQAEADAAKKAIKANVRSRDTRRAPTEPLGKMDDTMKDTLAQIRSRTH